MNTLTIQILGKLLTLTALITSAMLMLHYKKEAERLKKKLEFIKKHYDLEDAEFIFDSSEFDD